ncbi:Hsp70 family protein [Proteiniborus sp.]|uniref:Hsp70 family protein n=1 Tax=Proteiniborus sp. TaxID=2079015 RepID=UPI003334076E
MKNITIGIDFGTTNTSVAYMKYNNIWSVFSPECFDLDRNDTIRTNITYKDETNYWIGEDALIHSYEYPDGFVNSLKRQIVSDTLKNAGIKNKSDLDIVSDFLSAIMKKIEPQIPYKTQVGGVAVGVPIGFKDKDKELYLRAMLKAGIYKDYNVAKANTIFVSEPIASVLNYNLLLKDDKRLLVFDFGGGTLDLVIMDMKNIRNANEISPHDVISKKGRLNLGGDDFDKAILENIVVEKYGMRNLKRDLGINRIEDLLSVQEGIELMNQIREAKEELSRYEIATIAFEKGNLKMNIEITKKEYELAISSYLREIRELVLDCLRESGLNSNDIDIVVLSGGSSLTPAVQEILYEIFGRDKIKVNGDAMTSIARGLALRGYDPNAHKYNDILEHDYGVKMKDEYGQKDIIEIVLNKGRKIKELNEEECYKEFELTTNARGKNTFKVSICENNEEIGKAYVPLDEELTNANFKLYFTIDENSDRLELHIYESMWGKKLDIPIENRFFEINK